MRSEDRFIGKAIRATRRQAQVSQAQLADKMKVSRQVISKIETGQRKVSGMDLMKICWHLDRDIHFDINELARVFGRSD